MLSRVANSVYWMSRYIERAENVARMVGVNLRLLLDLPESAEGQWEPMVKVTGNETDFRRRYAEPTRDAVLEFLAFDDLNPDSIRSCIRRARQNARTVREIISSEMWEEINALYLRLCSAEARDDAVGGSSEFFQQIKRSSHLIEGTKNETMTHGEAWHFSRLGRFLERADQTTRILDMKCFLRLPSKSDVGKPAEDLQWSAVLHATSAFEAYRKVYGQVAGIRIVEFLLLDREFPRAVRHCMTGAQESLHAITGTPVRRFTNTAEWTLGRFVADLDYTQIEVMNRDQLHVFIDELQARFNDVSRAVRQTFYAISPPPEAPVTQ